MWTPHIVATALALLACDEADRNRSDVDAGPTECDYIGTWRLQLTRADGGGGAEPGLTMRFELFGELGAERTRWGHDEQLCDCGPPSMQASPAQCTILAIAWTAVEDEHDCYPIERVLSLTFTKVQSEWRGSGTFVEYFRDGCQPREVSGSTTWNVSASREEPASE